MKRVRLLKLIVQPVLVVDDGVSLVEQQVQPITLTAYQVLGFPTELFKQIDALQQQLNAAEGSGKE